MRSSLNAGAQARPTRVRGRRTQPGRLVGREAQLVDPQLTQLPAGAQAGQRDPARVTVAGESAGGHSIGQLPAAPRARGLCARGIVQSGSASFDVPIEQADVIGRAVLRRLGFDRIDDDALSGLDGAALLAASREVERDMFGILDAADVRPTLMSPATRVTSMPTNGGDVVPVRALDAIACGSARGVDLIVGTTLDETALFGPAFAESAPVVAEAAFGPAAPAAMAAYRCGSPDGTELEARTRLLTDTLFRVGALRLAAAEQAHASVHMYLLTWGSPPTGRALGAYHGLDLPFSGTGSTPPRRSRSWPAVRSRPVSRPP